MADEDYALYYERLASKVEVGEDGRPLRQINDQPACGFWKKRARKNGPWLPVATYRDENGYIVGKIYHFDQIVDLDAERVLDMWTFIIGNPVSYDDFKARVETGKWPGEVEDPTAGKEMSLAERVKATVDAARAWIAKIGGRIADEVTANEAGEWKDKLTKLERAAEAERKRLKAPHEEAAKAVDAQWFPIQRAAEGGKREVAGLLDAWGAAELARRRKEAEAERRRLEEEARAKAEALRQQQQDDMDRERERLERENPGLRFNHEPVIEDVPVYVPPVQAERVLVGGVSGGRRTGFKTVKVTTVVNYRAALAHYAEHEKVRELIEKLAKDDVKRGAIVPGVEVVETVKAA